MDPALHRLGWTAASEAAWRALAADGLRPARVAAQHRGGYVVLTGAAPDLACDAVPPAAPAPDPTAAHPPGAAPDLACDAVPPAEPAPDPTAAQPPGDLVELRADLSGKLRRAAAADPAAGPAVGDWAAIRGGERGCSTIHALLPRTSLLSRKAAGRATVEQVVAANVDTVLLVVPLDRPLAERRLERLLAIARASGAEAAVVLTKADLCADPDAARAAVHALCAGSGADVPVHSISSLTGDGLAALDRYTDSPRTSALIGASGVGKSTLLNRWLGHDRQAVAGLTSLGKGRHTTTHRELLVLPRGGLVIDTPGMRELGLWRADDGIQDVFSDIAALADGCRFRDCGHAEEPGCAVQAAIHAGALDPERAAGFFKLQREQAHVERERDDLARARARQADRRSHRALGRLYRDRGRE